MNRLKTLCLIAVVAGALTALAAPASATTLTSPKGTTYTSTIEATATNLKGHGAFVTVECSHSTAKATIEQHGESVSAGGKFSSLTFTSCNYTVTVNSAGSVAMDAGGVVKSTGAQVSIATSVGTCVFATNNTTVGTGTGGEGAQLDINSAKIPRTGGNFLCGSSGTLTGSYTVTSPSTLFLD
jgi:hypothetical protein